ncbi:porin [Nitrincola tapanii]|uniref:Porin n=1 Tax=Nitrincola tapanii TaxID=1708751 RepID=A0A5A9W6Q2_9GAMM|nr:porin [Nitrincola tapanii]KAA0876396.1 porin [Nitrincola tapanii]
MNNKKILKKALPAMIAVGLMSQANAGITLYDQGGTSFSADGFLNAFYTYQDQGDTQTSRVRMGFLPNYIGFNAAKEMDGITVGARSSFWVTINDVNTDDNNKTDTGIDVRQFYATVDGDFGQVLFGKDFGLYARSNIFNDELLMGVGLAPQGTSGTTFGNITAGYPYANPNAQITYRTPNVNGFQLAAGILDPNNNGAQNSKQPRFETELTYSTDFDGGMFSAWLGGASGKTNDVNARGVAYGAKVGLGGFALTASGFDQKGISTAFASDTLLSASKSSGYLVQASYKYNAVKGVLSYGETDNKNGTKNNLQGGAVFYDINSNLKMVAEYSTNKLKGSATPDTDTFAVGAVFSW